MFDTVIKETDDLNYYSPFVFILQRLERKYRLVKDNEPVQMFDWFKTRTSYENDKRWPTQEIYNEGWVQIESGIYEHLLDGHHTNRENLIYARFIDCVPKTKS